MSNDRMQGDLRFVLREEVERILDDGRRIVGKVRILQVWKWVRDPYDSRNGGRYMWVDVPLVDETSTGGEG